MTDQNNEEKNVNELEVQIGKRFKEFRQTFKIKQSDIEIMHKQNISRIEQGRRLPSHELMIYMHTKFNMDLNWLLTGEKLSTRNIGKPEKITMTRVTR
ncbi:helix-turn-helix domain-containing protein [Sphingobacterium faecium]|uniref:helix-turn-helix domain-containing protein n=1 Tax=Sphingobacterium faecium TaxID=34087 RepID=UPI003DA5BF4F